MHQIKPKQMNFSKNTKSAVSEGTTKPSLSQSTNTQSLPSQPRKTLPFKSEEQIQCEILQMRIESLKKLNSSQRPLQFESKRYCSNLQQPQALRRNNRIVRDQQSYMIQKYEQSTRDSLSMSLNKSNNSLQQISQDLTMNSTYSLLKSNQKRSKQLQGIINDFNYNFSKHVFKNYYEQFVNLSIIVIQEFDSVKEFAPLLPNRGRYNAEQEFKKQDLMYPPPYDRKDFKYIPEKTMFKLHDIKHNNLYLTAKSKNLIFVKFTIMNFIDFFKQLPQIFKQNLHKPFDAVKDYLHDLLSPQKIFRLNQKALQLYETHTLMLAMAKIIFEEIKAREIKCKEIKSKEIKSLDLSQINKIIEQKLLKFIEWISFYNFNICLYEHYNKKTLPLRNYVQSQRNNPMGYTDLKIHFFINTLQNPTLLERIFRESIALDSHAKQIIRRFHKQQYSIANFYHQFHRIREEEEIANNLSRYLTHFLQFAHELAIIVVSQFVLSLNLTYNSVRFIVNFFVCIFAKKVSAKILRQIHHSFGPFILEKVKHLHEQNKRHQSLIFSIDRNITTSFNKITTYLQQIKKEQKKGQKKNHNVEKIKSLLKNDPLNQSTNIIDFIQSLADQHKNPQPTSPEQDHYQMLLIYRYIVKLLATYYFSSVNNERCFRELTIKHFSSKIITIKDFLANDPIEQVKTQIKNIYDFKEAINMFEKDYKIVYIEFLQVYIMTTTLWCYSYHTEEENIRVRNKKNENQTNRKKQKTYKDVLTKLDHFYIMESSKIDNNFLKQRTLLKVHQILDRFTNRACLINQFFTDIATKDKQYLTVMKPNQHESDRQIVVPIQRRQCIYQQDSEQEMVEDQKFTNSSSEIHWKNSKTSNLSENSTACTSTKSPNTNHTELLNLNKIIDRQLHKGKLSIFGQKDSLAIARNLHKEFIVQKVMAKENLKKHLDLKFSFIDKEGKLHHSTTLSDDKSRKPSSTESKPSSSVESQKIIIDEDQPAENVD